MALDSSNPNDPPKSSGSDISSSFNEYFALKPANEIGAALMEKTDEYYEHLHTQGWFTLWKRCYEYYYKGRQRGARLRKSGKQNEYTLMNANHYRNILLHLLNSITSQRPEPEPRAINTDWDSQAQTITAKGVVDYYNREKKVERHFKKAGELGLVYGEGYVFGQWNAAIGEDYMADPNVPGQTVKQGDLEYVTCGPVDVIRDVNRDSSINHEWRIVRVWKNKYEMAAKYPAKAEDILSITAGTNARREMRFGKTSDSESDIIPVFIFIHEKTAALPQGRLVEFLTSDIVTIDGPLPYRHIPLYRMAPDEMDGTTFGYTIGFDLLAIQEAIDALYSTVVTNQSSFGVQNIAMPKNSNITVTQLAEGLNLIEYDMKAGGPPSGLNLTQTPKEIFAFIEQLEHLMETLSGVNSVTRGNPEASLKSGAALALIASQAIQFNSGLQQSYANLLEDVWSGIIEILQDFATTPRMALIVGKNNRPLMSSFTNKDIVKIQRVSVDLGNPIARTTAGKLQIAEDLLSKGLITTAQEYLAVLNTGRIEPLFENQLNQILLVRAENERMASGEVPPVLLTDDHVLHIKEHQSVLASPEARENPAIVKAVTTHLMQHMQILSSGNPILGILGQPMLAPPGVPPPPPGGGAADVKNPTNPTTAAAGKVNLPQMPKNPLTGQRAEPAQAAA